MEKILCSAIYHEGDLDHGGQPLIYCGLRHHNVLWQSDKVSRHPKDQGFLTDKGRFVNRLEAAEIAINAGQVIREKLDNSLIGLFSEDLY